MSEQLYELVFDGACVGGIPVAQVQENVARLFKASPDQIAQLFSGRRVVLKNRLPLATARKYLTALHKAGALCQLVDMQTGAPYVDAEPARAATTAERLQAAAEAEIPEATPSTAERLQATETSAPAEQAQIPPSASSQGASSAERGATLEPGSDYRVGGRPELEAPAWSVAPSGSRMQDENEALPVPEPDTDYLSLAPQEGNIVEPDTTPPPPAPDTSHLDLIDDPDHLHRQ